MLSLVLLTHATFAAADATGTWIGQLVAGDSQRTNQAHLILKQDGAKLTGSGGPNADEQHPIQNGTVADGGKLNFEIVLPNGMMRFALKQDGDSIEGEVIRERDGEKQSGKLTVKRAPGAAAAAATKPLPDVIGGLDAALFAAYNACEMEKFASYFHDSNVEFYHDKSGLTSSKSEIMNAVKNNICGKVRRELVAGSLEVYPLPGYGAVETGSHKFYNRQSGKEEGGDHAAKFLHIWQQGRAGDWKLTRVVSYAH